MIFIGLVGMIDPPRTSVISTIQMFANAGIKVAMITGDHKITALAIAKELGIANDENSNVITGNEIDLCTDEELAQRVKDTFVYARVSPDHKVRIVSAYMANNYVTGMTGDGVNDAPALKKANIGIAMGKSGTDVAKEAGDILLLDDNFSTIGVAVTEGRKIFRNIKKVTEFIVSTNVSTGLVVFILFLI
jgi:Ca2+-transporting ATPase